MKIAIIDDSMEDARQLSEFIMSFYSNVQFSQQTAIFNTAAQFMKTWRKGGFDLVFIDIYLKQEASGIQIAQQIRKEDEKCAIIFITSSTDFALKGYEVRALDYLVKPISYKKFSTAMEYYNSINRPKDSPFIEVKESRIKVKLPVHDILYTDYYNHYIQIHMPDKIVRTYMRFEDFSGLLLCYPQFISCYRNCIINMDKVTCLEKTEFIVNSGEHLPITRSLRAQIHQRYADYQFQKLNGGIQ